MCPSQVNIGVTAAVAETTITGHDKINSGQYELEIRKQRITTRINDTGIKKSTFGLAKDYQKGVLLLLFRFDNTEMTSQPLRKPASHQAGSV